MGTESVEAFPLCWPAAWPRTKAPASARFYGTTRRQFEGGGAYLAKRQKSVAEARDFLRAELARLGATRVVISTNVELRLDGEICGGRRNPDDPGVAVYFRLKGQERCFPCDRWDSVADNLWAIGKSIEAMRGLERWGAERMVDAAFTGFKALPESTGGPAWWETLGLSTRPTTGDEVRAAYRRRALEVHPDKPGGSDGAFRLVQAALGQGLAAVGEAR